MTNYIFLWLPGYNYVAIVMSLFQEVAMTDLLCLSSLSNSTYSAHQIPHLENPYSWAIKTMSSVDLLYLAVGCGVANPCTLIKN